jgi:subtilisin family serine protease
MQSRFGLALSRRKPATARRLRRVAWVACLSITLVGSGGPAAPAPSQGTSAPNPTPPARLGFGAGQYEVTLVTGDHVTLRRQPTGEDHIANVEAARRPDGSMPVSFEALHMPNGDLYLVPSDAHVLWISGALDRELFNLTYLVNHGYTDGTRSSVPVIVEYDEQLGVTTQRQRAEELPASDVTHTLESIDAQALIVNKSNSEDFWASLIEDPASPKTEASLKAGVAKVWLDRKIELDLNESVPQIGAPEAWESGYDGTGVKVAVLDTGIDETHPDVAAKVIASRSFIPNETVVDGHGHGTHVAATVAGTGAAQDGTYKGVAPGAQLVIGKVLRNSGSSLGSSVIDGMEWAALEQGADIINMSLGGAPTDGTDPNSQAVNQLTATTGALFVISAGNSGPGSGTVGQPGAADAALTVGAVNKSDQLASFSSRGPRLGNLAMKPDIAAPGVGIVAARAAETSLGTPVSDRYTRLNGTSMAAPHVAGAAAILAQKHPSWTANELKSALMSTATDASAITGTITSGPYVGTEYLVNNASGTPPIDSDTTISATPTFVGQACEPVPAGDGVALVERTGTTECSFQLKLDHIATAGYDAGIVFNNSQTACLSHVNMEATGDIPFVFVNRLTGLQLLQRDAVTSANACTRTSPAIGTSVASTTIQRSSDGYTVYEQGAGRVDVARAVRQQVFATTPSLDFGTIIPKKDTPSPPVTKTLTYRNLSNQPVTLELAVHLRAVGGRAAAPSGALVTPSQVTVAPDGSVSIEARLDPMAFDSEPDFYSGSVVATAADGTRLTTPVGLNMGLPVHKLSLTVKPRENVLNHFVTRSFLFRVDGSSLAGPRLISLRAGNNASAFVPEGTYMIYANHGWTDASNDMADAGRIHHAKLFSPEFTVKGDTTVELDANATKKITIDTPQPSELLAASFNWFRRATDGTWFGTGDVAIYGAQNYWVTPTDEHVTKGVFGISPIWYLGAPPVTMRVTKPERLELHPIYPHYSEWVHTDPASRRAVHFSEDETLPVVFVGEGRPEDFARVDARGKLVLLSAGCIGYTREHLVRALDARAAGVLFDGGLCAIPIGEGGAGGTGFGVPTRPNIPFVSLPDAEANLLIDLLSRESVKVRIASTSPSPYFYQLKTYEDERVPDSLDYRFTERDFTLDVSNFHGEAAPLNTTRRTFGQSWEMMRPGRESVLNTAVEVGGPRTVRNYVGPRYPDAVDFYETFVDDDEQSWSLGAEAIEHADITRSRRELHWNTRPLVPGAVSRPRWLPICAGCRQGDTFHAWMVRENQAGQSREPIPVGHHLFQHIRFYANGQELAGVPFHGFYGLAYPGLPSQPTRYRLTVNYDQLYHEPTGSVVWDQDVRSAWEFTSADVTHDETPPGLICADSFFEGSSAPCRADPLIFLRYEADVGLDNAVRAGRSGEIQVSAYRQGLTGPAISALKLSLSFDDGTTWQPVKVKARGGGVFEADVRYPRFSSTTGAVSLKAEAWDVDGNRVEQTVTRAYGLREGSRDDDDDDDDD